MYMNRAAKRLLYLGAAVSLCLSMGWGAADAADLAGAPHEVVTAEQEMVLAAPQVILNPNIRYANAARTPYEAKVWRLDAPVGQVTAGDLLKVLRPAGGREERNFQ